MSEKSTLKQRYEDLQKRYDSLEKAYNDLVNAKADDFRQSSLYRSMQRDIEFVKKIESFEKNHFEFTSTMSERQKEEIKKLYEDNKKFMESAGGSYWIGMTRDREVSDLEKQLTDLKGKLVARDQTIAYLKQIINAEIYGEEVPPAEEIIAQKKPGRKKTIDDATIRRVKKLRKDGASIRSIAKIEGISVGSVDNILNN